MYGHFITCNEELMKTSKKCIMANETHSNNFINKFRSSTIYFREYFRQFVLYPDSTLYSSLDDTSHAMFIAR